MISQRERGEFARFYTVTDPIKHPKGYTVYKVTARIISRKSPEDVQEITVSKRYSDFRTLHQNLWQLHKSLCSQSELFPPFAKAKVFGRFDESVIETRRQCSEDLLQFSANIPALYSSQHIQDFFKGGDVHDGSELIGPAEPFSDFLADSLSDCSSEVNRDLSGADDWTFTSEYGGPTSESDLTSLVADTDSLGELDDGMASGRTSPNQPPRGAPNSSGSCSPFLRRLPPLHARHSPPPPAPAPGPLTPRAGQEASRPGGRSLLFSGALRRAAGGSAEDAKPDYLDRAGEHIQQALRREAERDYQAAFSYYRSGVDLLLQGVQGEPSPTRREAVKKRTAEYLMRAELIANQYLRDDMGQGSTQTVAMVGAQCCPPTSRGKPSPAEELRAYRVLGVIDKVLLVMDKRTQETFILKGLQKSSDCGRAKGSIMPSGVPNMVRLRKFIVAEDTVYLLLQYAEGGKLWSHIGKFLRCSSPDDSFDIPFIQKSHTTAVHSPQRAAPAPQASASASGSSGSGSGSGPATSSPPCPGSRPQRGGGKPPPPLHPKGAGLPPGLAGGKGGTPESGGTSEEECTNSYLTLCNEYEQDKVEPDELEEDEEARSGHEASSLSLDAPAAAAADATASASPRSHSLRSNDSLSSPVSAQELCFFAESAGGEGEGRGGEEPEPGEVFSPLPSPAGPGLSLDRSKHTPMEFFRIDSKDSASEVICLDVNVGGDLLTSPKPLGPDPDSKLREEELPEMAREVTGLGFEPWGLDPGDDAASNESVPVISFKEAAAAADEGPPPDLLVNLPAGGGAGGTASESEAPEAPGACRRPGPDVLQLHGGPEDAPAAAPPAPGHKACQSDPSVPSPAPLPEPDTNTEFVRVRPDEGRVPGAGGGGAEPSLCPGDPDEGGVARLFAALDELTLAAAHVHIPEEFVRCWAVEMVTALDALHQEGVVCRDLNPNNILVNHQGHIQLTYFCSWSDVEDSYDKEAMANMYCAPEVGGISEETAACDWWSLGAILFELLTGKVSRKSQSVILSPPLPKKYLRCKVLSSVCRCLGFQLTPTLCGAARFCIAVCSCVCACAVARALDLFSCFSVCVCVCVCVCERVRERERESLVLAAVSLSGSRECQGCRCDFLPPA
ncbi:ribosomal protein S6 kinase delta-1 [Gadus chalcogrammus]|uniref:ribosomal protein S6 kinase delta-1 n=1 Tax=Gadus chalcogrammus TaxID=1042646 RepID=UPI0024C4BDFF|nr:ribosomal protein S6 kinase delta-1 [Gadus chalcogrammus]